MPGPNTPYTHLSANQVLQQAFDEANDRLRVDASVTASIVGDISCEIDAADGDNVALSNADGSKKVSVTTLAGKNGLDVNVINAPSGVQSNVFNEISSVVNGALTDVVTFTATTTCRLKKVAVSGTNIATYSILIDAITTDKARTYFGSSLNAEFNFEEGLPLSLGQVVRVKVIHDRPDLGDFNGRIQIEV